MHLAEGGSMVHDLSVLRTSAVTARARLESHLGQMLGCDPGSLLRPGTAIVVADARSRPDWRGRTQALWSVTPLGSSATVISCQAGLADRIDTALTALPRPDQPWESTWLTALQRAVAVPSASWSIRYLYYADDAAFRPHGVDPSIKIERWLPNEQPESPLRQRFDGPCYVIRSGGGRIVAWAGVRLWSDLAVEVAAETEAAYRGRGLATSLTAQATADIVAAGRLALWTTTIDDHPAQRLVERLGFELYGRQIMLESAR